MRRIVLPVAVVALFVLTVLEALLTIRVQAEGPTLYGFLIVVLVLVVAAILALYFIRYVVLPAPVAKEVIGSWLFLSLFLYLLIPWSLATVVAAVVRLFNGFASDWVFVVFFIPSAAVTILDVVRQRKALRASPVFAATDDRVIRYGRLAASRYSGRMSLVRAPQVLLALILLWLAPILLVTLGSIEKRISDIPVLLGAIVVVACGLAMLAFFWSNRFCVSLIGEGIMSWSLDLMGDSTRNGPPSSIAARLLQTPRNVGLAEATEQAETFIRTQVGDKAYLYAIRIGDCDVEPEGLKSDCWIFSYCLPDRRAGLEVAIIDRGEVRTRFEALQRLLPARLERGSLSLDALARGLAVVRSRTTDPAAHKPVIVGGELRGGLGLLEESGITPERLRWLIWVTSTDRSPERLFVLDALDGSVAGIQQRRQLREI